MPTAATFSSALCGTRGVSFVEEFVSTASPFSFDVIDDGDCSHRPLCVSKNSILSPILYCCRQKERNSLMLSMNWRRTRIGGSSGDWPLLLSCCDHERGARVKLAKEDRTERENRMPETTTSAGKDVTNEAFSSLGESLSKCKIPFSAEFPSMSDDDAAHVDMV